LSGMELAIYLSGMGRGVTVMEMSNSLNYSGNVIHALAIEGELKRLGVNVVVSTRAVEIGAGGVTGEFVGDKYSPAPLCETIRRGILQSVVTGGNARPASDIGVRHFYPADTVVYALGQKPLRGGALALRECAPMFFQLGDCMDARNIYTAVSTAYTVAKDIGRV